MSFAAAVESLTALGLELAPGAPRRKFELAHMRTLAETLGDPQKKFPSVLIAGTNGKGSTAATLASILVAAGYRTGLYTSPHLERVTERIRIAEAGDVPETRSGLAPPQPAAARASTGTGTGIRIGRRRPHGLRSHCLHRFPPGMSGKGRR